MSFLTVLSKVLSATEALAPTVANAINPAAGAIVNVVVSSVARVEQAGGTGASKKEAVMAEVMPLLLPLLTAVLKSSRANVNLNPDGIREAASQIVDGVVALLNAVQPSATPAAAPPVNRSV